MRKSVFFQQVQQVNLKTRYTNLSHDIGHNLSPKLSTFAPAVPWLDGNPSSLEKLHLLAISINFELNPPFYEEGGLNYGIGIAYHHEIAQHMHCFILLCFLKKAFVISFVFWEQICNYLFQFCKDLDGLCKFNISTRLQETIQQL